MDISWEEGVRLSKVTLFYVVMKALSLHYGRALQFCITPKGGNLQMDLAPLLCIADCVGLAFLFFGICLPIINRDLDLIPLLSGEKNLKKDLQSKQFRNDKRNMHLGSYYTRRKLQTGAGFILVIHLSIVSGQVPQPVGNQ